MPLVRKPIGLVSERHVDAATASCSWVGQNIGPPVLARGLLRVRPRSAINGLACLEHGGKQAGDIRPVGVQQHEVRHGSR